MVYKCHDCDITYKTIAGLQQHINFKHSTIQLLQCDKCYKHFVNKYSLRKHLNRTHLSKLHSCTFCGSSFKRKNGRDEHITSVHTGEKSFRCKICPSKFSTAPSLRAHQVVHKDSRPHGCKLCSKQFKSLGYLYKHVKRIHTKRTKEFTCTECNKAYFTKSHLIRHQNIHKNHGEECYFCHNKFSQSSTLVTHTRSHTQEKPFSCSEKFCSYSSARLGDVKRHNRRKHSSTSTSNQINRRSWICYFCSKTCKEFNNLIIHMRQHTKEVPFNCNFCKKKYIRQKYLTYHIASHTNEKPFSCSQCEKEFKTNSNLKCHMVTHTKEKRYFCQFCSYGSYFRTNLNRHIVKRHDSTYQ